MLKFPGRQTDLRTDEPKAIGSGRSNRQTDRQTERERQTYAPRAIGCGRKDEQTDKQIKIQI